MRDVLAVVPSADSSWSRWRWEDPGFSGGEGVGFPRPAARQGRCCIRYHCGRQYLNWSIGRIVGTVLPMRVSWGVGVSDRPMYCVRNHMVIDHVAESDSKNEEVRVRDGPNYTSSRLCTRLHFSARSAYAHGRAQSTGTVHRQSTDAHRLTPWCSPSNALYGSHTDGSKSWRHISRPAERAMPRGVCACRYCWAHPRGRRATRPPSPSRARR